MADSEKLLQVGRNCWRVEHARRLAFLIDGEACFAAMRAAMAAAQRSIFLLGWDIDSRIELVRGPAQDDLPTAFADFLAALLERRSELEVRILSWDYAMLYALEREWLPALTFGARQHARLTFRLDASHPLGASHHQKLLVIDDAVAFVGGFDLTRSRWDTSAHRAGDRRRRDADGRAYAPFHDIHAIVDGAAARAIGDLARERWCVATGESIAPIEAAGDPWPAGLAVDVGDLEVGIARTHPAWNGREAVAEIRQLLLDAIASARRIVLSENQYFTADAVASALTARLGEADGPDFVSITSRAHSGWLEETTMGVLRARLHQRLKAADRHWHYAVYYPCIPGLGDECINVHSKLFAIDDRLLTLGSANLSNRSLGLDSECNIVIEAGSDTRVAQAIAHLRNRLLAEHLDTSVDRVAEAFAQHPRAIEAVESLRDDGRSLASIDFELDADADALVPDRAIFDPERPIDPDRLIARLFPAKTWRSALTKMAAAAALLLVLCTLLGLWLLTPLRDWVDIDRLVGLAERFGSTPLVPLVLFGAFVAGGLIAFPVNVLIAVTIILCGPLPGALYALIGSLLSAQVLYEVGRWFGRGALRRFSGQRLESLRRRLARRGLLAIVIVRLLPIAPYSVVNLVSGVAHIDRRVYALGTLLGMLPGIVLSALFVDRALAAIRHPSPWTYTLLVAVVLLIAGATLIVRRRMARSMEAGK
ncbi:MAG: VTT domain-containing protein [Rhodanobacteraceae bacterium]